MRHPFRNSDRHSYAVSRAATMNRGAQSRAHQDQVSVRRRTADTAPTRTTVRDQPGFSCPSPERAAAGGLFTAVKFPAPACAARGTARADG